MTKLIKDTKCPTKGCNQKMYAHQMACSECVTALGQPNYLRPHLEKYFTAREERILTPYMLVGVHWNSHENVWSIVRMNSRHTVGLVLGYAKEVTLREVTTHIDKAKQKKVLESPTQAKDRHAFMVGYIDSLEYEALERNIYYKPQDVENFVDAEEFFKNGEKEFIEYVDRVSLTWDSKKDRPLVTYNPKNPCDCNSHSRFVNDHGCCEYCFFVGE